MTLLALGESDFRRLADPTTRSATVFEEQIARYDFRFVARVPLDFAEELLPADSVMPEKVGLEQVDEVREGPPAGAQMAEEWAGAETASRPQADQEFPARLADRRDGLRRRLPGDGLPPLRAGGQPAAPPEGRLHGSRRHEPDRDRGRRRVGRSPRPLREGVEDAPRRAAAARRLPLRGQPLGRALRHGRPARAPRRPGASASSG